MASFSQFGNDLYTGKRSFDFVKRRRIWFSIAIVMVIISIVVPFVRGGFVFGIEFSGGSEFTVSNPAKMADGSIDQALATFDASQQDAIMAKVHEKVVDDAVLIWVVHDTNPHALSPKIKSYIQAQHWFQDLTTIGV